MSLYSAADNIDKCNSQKVLGIVTSGYASRDMTLVVVLLTQCPVLK